MARPVTEAWRTSRQRFKHLKSFVRDSYKPDASAEYRQSAYSSWILLAYAAAESSFVDAASAALSVIGNGIASPAALPEQMRNTHRERTLRHLLSDVSALSFATTIHELEGQDWALSSKLLSIERNVRVTEIRGWFGRLEGPSTIEWLSSEIAENGETLASIWDVLVQERNDIAHGQIPTQLSNADVVAGRIVNYETFVRHSMKSLHRSLAGFLGVTNCRPIGTIDEAIELGDSTLAVQEVESVLQMGDHLLLVDNDGRVRVGNILSMQHAGISLEEATPGMQEVAVSLSCDHQKSRCLEAF